GVGCFGDRFCVAVGDYHDPTTGDQAWIEDFQLRWQPQDVLVPSGSIASGINDISCVSSSFCMAVDSYENSDSTFGTSAQEWNGGAWQDLATPNPLNSYLSGVSCT